MKKTGLLSPSLDAFVCLQAKCSHPLGMRGTASVPETSLSECEGKLRFRRCFYGQRKKSATWVKFFRSKEKNDNP